MTAPTPGPTPYNPITSTKQLIPDGIAGYRKAISAVVGLLGTVLVAVQPSLPAGSDWARWVGIGIAVCGAVGVYLAANAVKATPPAPVGTADGPQI